MAEYDIFCSVPILMQRSLTLRYVFGGDNLKNYQALKGLPPIEIEGWSYKAFPEWGNGMTLRVNYANYGSAHQIDLPKLFSNYIQSFESVQILDLLQTAEVKQGYKSSLTTYTLPLNLNVEEFNRIADSLNKTAQEEDGFSCFNCAFHCLGR